MVPSDAIPAFWIIELFFLCTTEYHDLHVRCAVVWHTPLAQMRYYTYWAAVAGLVLLAHSGGEDLRRSLRSRLLFVSVFGMPPLLCLPVAQMVGRHARSLQQKPAAPRRDERQHPQQRQGRSLEGRSLRRRRRNQSRAVHSAIGRGEREGSRWHSARERRNHPNTGTARAAAAAMATEAAAAATSARRCHGDRSERKGYPGRSDERNSQDDRRQEFRPKSTYGGHRGACALQTEGTADRGPADPR